MYCYLVKDTVCPFCGQTLEWKVEKANEIHIIDADV